MVFGVILLAVGVIAILVQTGVVAGSIWDYTWPAVLIIIGLSWVMGRIWRFRWWGGSPWFGRPPWWGGPPPPRDDRDKDKNK
jgi:hypothetical protein